MVVSNHVYIMLLVGPISAPKCLSYQELLRSCSELLFGCSKLKTKDFIPILRIYGFEGEDGREGGRREGFTRTDLLIKSSPAPGRRVAVGHVG